MSDSLRKVAVVTGGNRGIGKSTALHLAKRGVGVILTYNTHRDEGEAVAAEIRSSGGKARAIQLDIGKTAVLDDFSARITETLRSEWQRETFDYLVNNAGNSQRTTIPNITEAQFDDLVNVHLKGVFFLTQKLMPKVADNGHIVFVSSGLARFTSPVGVAVYASLKGAVEVLTRYFAVEFAARKIRANCVAPGALDTDFGGGRTDEIRKLIGDHTLLGRIGVADDIGPFIAALVSDECRWVNAQRIEISGGTQV